MALILHKIRVTTFVSSLFHRAAVLSSVSPIRSLGVQKFQKEILTSSSFGEKLYSTNTTDEEKERDTRGSNYRRIFVGNLLRGKDCLNEEKIFRYFSQYGKIKFLEFHRDKLTKLPRGFAFVTFYDAGSAQKVLVEADPHIIDGQKVTVQIPKEFLSNRPAVQKRELTVFVNNISKDTSKQAVEEHFSQFGKVDRVILAKKDPEGKSSYYVIFSSLSGAKKALEQSMQKVADQDIESQVIELPRTAREYVGKTKCISITSVPDHLTVEDLRDYFQKFGVVESVDIVVNGGFWSRNRDEGTNVAFVRFANYTTIEEIVANENHVISGSTVRVCKFKDTGNLVSKDLRELKISVKGLPLSVRPKDVQEYFERTFGVVPNGVFLNKLACIVRLSNINEVERVLKQLKGTLHGQPLYFHRLTWKRLKPE